MTFIFAMLLPIFIAILAPFHSNNKLCHAEGQLTVFQHCPPNSVFYAFVQPSQPDPPAYQQLGSDVVHHYGDFAEGTSLKIGRGSPAITQIEFGWDKGAHKVWYDLSSLDGTPFANDGLEIYTDRAPSAEFPMCQTLDCPAGYPGCHDAFQNPADEKSMSCSEDTNLVVGLCIGSGFGDPQKPPQP